jgi:hypoxanthine phosphoribosyltransferase
MTEMSKKILFDSDTIALRVGEMAREISTKYPGENVLFIGILKGAFVFMADLVRALDVACEVDFARISSYGTGTESKGELDVIMDIGIPVKGRHVILVDDIVDSGLTLSEFRKRIQRDSPKSVEVAALVDKTARREKEVQVDYCGFQIEDGFIVGYGLDCNECYRNLNCICVLEE